MKTALRPLNIPWRANWPQGWPNFSWRKWLISSSAEEARTMTATRPSTSAFELGSDNLHEALFSCFPRLSLVQLAHLFQQWDCSQELKEDLDWRALLAAYSLRDSQSQRLTLQKITQTPEAFQSWAHQKDLGPRDLAVLLNFESPNPDLDLLLNSIAKASSSKSIGVQILELGGELLLMGKTPLPLWTEPRPEAYLTQLETLRKPLSHRALEDRNKDLSSLPWPVHCSGRWLRAGDALMIEAKVMGSNFKELRQRLDSLSKALQSRETDAGVSSSKGGSPSQEADQ